MGYPTLPYGTVSGAYTGAVSASLYVGATTTGAPAAGTFAVGNWVVARDGHVFICTVAGTPGTWVDAGSSGNLVTSVFSRTGAVVAGNADYLAVPSGGLTGAVAATRYVGGTTLGAPASGAFLVGDFVIDQTGHVYVNIAAGSPGTWIDAATDPERLRAQVQGFVRQTGDRSSIIGNQALSDGIIFFNLLQVYKGDVLSALTFDVQIAGVTMTLSKMGLYTTAGARLAVTADQATAWETTGLKTGTFTAAYTATFTGSIFTAVIAKATVSVPSIGKLGGTGSGGTAFGAGVRPFARQTGQTDLGASQTPADGDHGFWIGVS